MKSFKEFLTLSESEISNLLESDITVNVDWYGDVRDPAVQKELRKHKLTAKIKGKDSADLTGSKANVAKYLHTVHHRGEYKNAQELIDDGIYSELNEAKDATVNVDWYGDVRDPAVQKELRKHKLTAKITGKDSADLTGSKANIAKYLHTVHHSREYDSAQELVDDMYPELNEAKDATVNVDWYGDVRDPAVQKELRKHKLTAKITGKDSADLTGSKANIAKYLHTVHHSREYDSAQELVDDLYPELN